MRDIPDAVIKAFVGHAQATGVSARYAHTECEHIRDFVNSIDLRKKPVVPR